MKRAAIMLGVALLATGVTPAAAESKTVRFATFNASLNRGTPGALISDLSTPDNAQARTVAEIIQRTRPDVLLINEFDFDAAGRALKLFQDNYLSVGHNGARPIRYAHRFTAPSNTGIASGHDLNNDGQVVTQPGSDAYGQDSLGYGLFPGQFGMAVYSRHPIDHRHIRTFQRFRWAHMPGALLPDGWYSPAELGDLRLSSKSHWDLPLRVGGRTVHFLASHPTPPTFDGPEDRNGLRNHDEIRFWADYIDGRGYIYDDRGRRGGLGRGERFVIAGDQNADPLDGDSVDHAIDQLLRHRAVDASVEPSSAGAAEAARLQGGANAAHRTDPALDTADFADGAPGNLRVDYVLPSSRLRPRSAGVFWPTAADPLSRLTGTFPFPSSDHRLTWLDVAP